MEDASKSIAEIEAALTQVSVMLEEPQTSLIVYANPETGDAHTYILGDDEEFGYAFLPNGAAAVTINPPYFIKVRVNEENFIEQSVVYFAVEDKKEVIRESAWGSGILTPIYKGFFLTNSDGDTQIRKFNLESGELDVVATFKGVLDADEFTCDEKGVCIIRKRVYQLTDDPRIPFRHLDRDEQDVILVQRKAESDRYFYVNSQAQIRHVKLGAKGWENDSLLKIAMELPGAPISQKLREGSRVETVEGITLR
jgi:hypothetical protein